MTAIVFDVDDTLYDLAEPYRRAVGEFFGNLPGIPLDELFLRSRVHSDVAYDLVLAGKEPAEYMHIYRVQKAFADFGMDVSTRDALAFQREYERQQHQLRLSPAVRGMLDACVWRGVTLGVITNGDSAHQWEKLNALGVCHWVPREHVVVSGDIGVRKPDVRAFREAERRLGVSADDCWFLGDTLETDILGATSAGWHSVWVRRRPLVATQDAPVPDVVANGEDEIVKTVLEVVNHGA